MRSEPLPPDLRELQEQLARRPCPEPAADFRARVLSAMANADRLPVAARFARRWRLVWQVAAAVVLALNLGMSAANAVRFQRLTPPALTQPVPPGVADPFDANDRFQRVATRALAGLTPAPDIGPLSRNCFTREEERGWALP
jgi:hypothetical protein